MQNGPKSTLTGPQQQLIAALTAPKKFQDEILAALAKVDDLNFYDKNGYTPLHLACLTPWVEVVKAMLTHKGIEVGAKTQDELRQTALHITHSTNNLAMAQVLVQAEPRMRTCLNAEYESPMHLAAEKNQVEFLELYLGLMQNNQKLPIEIDCRGGDDATPLHIAAFHGSYKAAEVLLAAGANMDARDSTNKTPAVYATKSHFSNPKTLQLVSECVLPLKVLVIKSLFAQPNERLKDGLGDFFKEAQNQYLVLKAHDR